MLLKFIRVWLGTGLCLAGIIVIGVGGFSEHSLEVGIPLFSAGGSIWLLNVLYRIGVQGDTERGTEEEAREYFAEHGRWPDQESPGGKR